MSREEMVGEVEWLLNGGVSPLLVPAQLRCSWKALEMRMRRAGRPDLGSVIHAAFAHERYATQKVAA